MRVKQVLSVLSLTVATSAPAQERISPDTFLDQANGQTLTFTDRETGARVGIEQFLSRTRTVWAMDSGRCTYGTVEIRGPYMCFIYEDFPEDDNCWLPHIMDGKLTVLSQNTWQIQIVTDITTSPVICEDAPLS